MILGRKTSSTNIHKATVERRATVQRAWLFDDGMKRAFWISIMLLFAAMQVGTAAAQSLEERMRTAAGAYEKKDFAVAIGIWRPLAMEGNAEAQTLLGAMYWSGEGVPRDHAEAAKWYLRAAEKGYARAQNNIGFMLGFG